MALQTMALVFWIFAMIMYVGAFIFFVFAVNAGNGQPDLNVPESIAGIASCLVLGVLYHGISAFLDAFRDMARNSFK